MSELSPVAPSERIGALDLLRGFAMFGVLWSNLNDWYGTADEVTRLDRALDFSQQWLIESRFYTLLCFLFGIGFAIQLHRAAERGVSIRGTYVRRSAALLAIGLVHALLIWQGDILTTYALASFALLLFRDLSPRQQLGWAIGIYVFSRDVLSRARWLIGQRVMVPFTSGVTERWVYGHGSLAQIQHARVVSVADWFGRWGLMTYFAVLAMFLAGVWAFRSGFARRMFSEPRFTWRVLLVSAVVAALGFLVQIYANKLWPPLTRPPAGPGDWRFWYPRQLVLHTLNLSTEASAIAYAALMLLVFQTSRGARLLAPLAATGRMALTTYLTQSLVCTLLFYSFGLGLYGRVGYTGMLAITVTLFAAQMAASTWWIRRYRFGPVEWVWRTLTYGRVP
jgi:uncharacterized protein